MTELQAAVGLAQIKKMKFILKENKKRFDVLNKSIIKRTYIRKIYPGSTPSYDTFLFKVKKNQKNKITNYLNKVGIGTKNLPDAIKWHFAFYWRHAISKNQLKNTYKSKKILENYIAVPILLKKSVSFYREISKNLAYFL
jgi:dTDP-4-amino-4,6-dideoxygalactose transaminase